MAINVATNVTMQSIMAVSGRPGINIRYASMSDMAAVQVLFGFGPGLDAGEGELGPMLRHVVAVLGQLLVHVRGLVRLPRLCPGGDVQISLALIQGDHR